MVNCRVPLRLQTPGSEGARAPFLQRLIEARVFARFRAKGFTTALQVIESAACHPTRVWAFDKRAAGATVESTERSRLRYTARPRDQQKPMPATVRQNERRSTSATRAGSSERSRVSSIKSTAHMPRVIRRTMIGEVIGVQSDENRWTRQKASEATRDIIRVVRRRCL